MKRTLQQRLERRAEVAHIIRAMSLRYRFRNCRRGGAHEWVASCSLAELWATTAIIREETCRKCELVHWRRYYFDAHGEEVLDAEAYDEPCTRST